MVLSCISGPNTKCCPPPTSKGSGPGWTLSQALQKPGQPRTFGDSALPSKGWCSAACGRAEPLAGPSPRALRGRASLLTGCCALILTVWWEDKGAAQVSVGTPPHCTAFVTNLRIPWEKSCDKDNRKLELTGREWSKHPTAVSHASIPTVNDSNNEKAQMKATLGLCCHQLGRVCQWNGCS